MRNDPVLFIPAALADAIGANALASLATIYSKLTVPIGESEFHAGRAFHPRGAGAPTLAAAVENLRTLANLPDEAGDAARACARDAIADYNRQRDDMARRIVGEDVRYCVSSLVANLAKRQWDGSDGVDPDALLDLFCAEPDADDYSDSEECFVSVGGKRQRAYDVEAGDEGYRWTECAPLLMTDDTPAEKGDWHDTALEAWQALFDDQNLDRPDGREVFEHWLVTPYLAGRLRAAGEVVSDEAIDGLTIWGRTTTGQAIYADAVLQRIAADAID